MTNLPPAMPGRLIYLMGPSGAGKDSLIGAAREILSARGCRIARRVITRSSTRGEEGAQCVSATRFAQLERAGAFAMSWRAHGMAYGIPTQIDDWLAAGWYVLVNGSRSYWPEALRRYPRAQGVLLSVDREELRRRLLARGRETPAEIEVRLARNDLFPDGLGHVASLDNSGSLARTLEHLCQLIGPRMA